MTTFSVTRITNVVVMQPAYPAAEFSLKGVLEITSKVSMRSLPLRNRDGRLITLNGSRIRYEVVGRLSSETRIGRRYLTALTLTPSRISRLS